MIRGLCLLLAAAVVSFGQPIKDVTRGAAPGGGSETTSVTNSGAGRAVLKVGTNVHARTLAEACGIAMVEGADEVSVARSAAVNAQTGTTYTVLTGDCGKLVTHSNASAIAVTLPQAGASFPAGWFVDVQNRGAGTVTITPTTSTLDGAANLALTQNQGVRIFSDGTNYFTQRGSGGITGTSGGVPYFGAGGGMASSAALGSGQVLVGGGAGNPPTTSSGLAFNSGTNSLGVIGNVTVGQTGTATGEVKINGITSGTVTITSESAAGTYELRVPALAANAYAGNYTSGTADPPGTCVIGSRYVETDTNEAYTCTSANTWTLDSGTAGAGYATVSEEGSALTQRTTVNFIGSGITCADDAGNSRTNCTVSNGSGATAVTGLTDLKVERNSSTQLTVGGSCSTSATCLVRVGNTQYTFADSQTITSPSGASGTVWVGVATDGTLTAWHSLTDITVSAGITKSSGATGWPAGAVPIGSATVVSDAFEATGVADARAMLSRERAAVAGSGIQITNNANGQQTIAAADSVVQFTAGTADPPATCATGSRYIETDTSEAYTCVTTDTWVIDSGAAGSVAFNALTGGTNTGAAMVVGAGASLRTAAGIFGVPASTTLPATCTVGDAYMDTDATSGQRWHLCESTNTWVLQGGAGGGLSDGDKGDITVSASGATWTVDNSVITPAKTSLGTINSGGMPYFSSGTGWASSAALGAGDAILGGGAGATPYTTAASGTRLNISDRLFDHMTTAGSGVNRVRIRSTLASGTNVASLSFYDAFSTGTDVLSLSYSIGGTHELNFLRGTTSMMKMLGGTSGFVGIGQTAPTPVSTLGIQDMTATTGATSVIIQAGANQNAIKLTRWLPNNATHGTGTDYSWITADGAFAFGSDPADAGAVRCSNNTVCIGAEIATPGTDMTITPNSSDQWDFSHAIKAPGFISTGGGVAGYTELTQGTATSPNANSVIRVAPTSISTAYTITEPSAVGTSGFKRVAVSGTVATESHGPLVAGDLPAASDTAVGGVELATAAETTTGTDATRAVTPDGLAGSVFGLERIGGECIADATALTVADGKCYFPIPASLNGSVVESVEVFLGAAVSSSGAVTVDIDRCGAVATGIRCSGTNVSIFSTLATIDANESKTSTAATASVINASNDDLATGDYLRVNVDGAGTGSQGLYVWVNVRTKP